MQSYDFKDENDLKEYLYQADHKWVKSTLKYYCDKFPHLFGQYIKQHMGGWNDQSIYGQIYEEIKKSWKQSKG